MSGRITWLWRGLLDNLRDPLLRNSYLIMITTLMMAGGGSVFWVIAARLSPSHDVGLAGSLVSAAEALAVLALLGMDIVLIRIMPTSDRKAADVNAGVLVVGSAGFVLGVGYVLALPLISPRLHDLLGYGWGVAYAVLVAGTATNQFTDHLFLAVDRVIVNLRINGIMLSTIKLALPFALAGLGALGLYGSVGLATLVAAIVSVMALQRALPGRAFRLPSRQFRASFRFARAGYVANTLNLVPQLTFPLLIINEQGPSQSALYFVGFQIVSLLNQAAFSMCNSMYSEASRRPHQVLATVRKAGLSLAVVTTLGAAVLIVVAPLVMLIFGHTYADHGTANLRVLALGSLGVALNVWSAVRLRIASHHVSMMSVQAFTTALMLALAIVLVHVGIEGVAAAWGLGQFAGGVVGLAVSRTIAPLRDADEVPA